MLLQFRHPFTMCIAAPTGGGKTYLAQKIVTTPGLIDTKFDKIFIFMAEDQEIYREFGTDNLTIVKGPPTPQIYDSLLKEQANLFVLDDLMTTVQRDSFLSKLFFIGSHHKSLSIIYLSQNIFCKGAEARTVSLNLHYIILMAGLPDQNQINILGRRYFPEHPKLLIDAFKQISRDKYGYLVLVSRLHTQHQDLRLITDLFEKNQAVFLPTEQVFKYGYQTLTDS